MTKEKAVLGSYVGVLLYASFIFLAAGELFYWQAILYVVLALTGTTLGHLLEAGGSNLTVERATKAVAGQSWDKRLLGALFLVNIVTFVTAGLDSGRFGWSGPVPLWVTIVGAALMFTGQILFVVAKRENRFFSSTVRIQSERGHEVCDSGLYAYVRHPGYLGMLISQLAFPLVLNSYWAFLPAVVGGILLIVRTVMEDQVLSGELPGYREYAERTSWKLVPGVF